IRTIQNMNSFSGKAAEQAKQYFSDVHLTLLGAFHKAFGDLYNRLARHVQTFESEVDSGSNARIQINYLEDLKEDIDDTYGNLQDDLDAFTQKKQTSSIDELLHHIQVTMERAGTVQGSERFDDYVDLVALKGLHALKATVKAYEQDNMSDQLGVANSIVMDMP